MPSCRSRNRAGRSGALAKPAQSVFIGVALPVRDTNGTGGRAMRVASATLAWGLPVLDVRMPSRDISVYYVAPLSNGYFSYVEPIIPLMVVQLPCDRGHSRLCAFCDSLCSCCANNAICFGFSGRHAGGGSIALSGAGPGRSSPSASSLWPNCVPPEVPSSGCRLSLPSQPKSSISPTARSRTPPAIAGSKAISASRVANGSITFRVGIITPAPLSIPLKANDGSVPRKRREGPGGAGQKGNEYRNSP